MAEILDLQALATPDPVLDCVCSTFSCDCCKPAE